MLDAIPDPTGLYYVGELYIFKYITKMAVLYLYVYWCCCRYIPLLEQYELQLSC